MLAILINLMPDTSFSRLKVLATRLYKAYGYISSRKSKSLKSLLLQKNIFNRIEDTVCMYYSVRTHFISVRLFSDSRKLNVFSLNDFI